MDFFKLYKLSFICPFFLCVSRIFFFFAKDGEIHCPVVTRNEQILTKEEF